MTQDKAHELLPLFNEVANHIDPPFEYTVEVDNEDLPKGPDWNIVIHETNAEIPEGEQPNMFMYAYRFMAFAEGLGFSSFAVSCEDCGTVSIIIH